MEEIKKDFGDTVRAILLSLLFVLFDILLGGLFIKLAYNGIVEVLFTLPASMGIIPLSLTYSQGVTLAISLYLLKGLFPSNKVSNKGQ